MTRDLDRCRCCGSDLVYMESAVRVGDAWRIARRCPNCEWRHVGLFGQGAMDHLNDALSTGTEDLLFVLRAFEQARMAADAERLIDALQADRIEPLDF